MLYRQKGVPCGRPSLNEAGQKNESLRTRTPAPSRASSVLSSGVKGGLPGKTLEKIPLLGGEGFGNHDAKHREEIPRLASPLGHALAAKTKTPAAGTARRNLHPNRSVQRGNGNVASESRLPGRNVHRGGKVMSLQGKVPMRQKTHPKKEITAGAGVPLSCDAHPGALGHTGRNVDIEGASLPRSRLHKEIFRASLGGFLQGKFHRTVVTPFSRPFPEEFRTVSRRGAGTTPAPPGSGKTIRSTAGEGPSSENGTEKVAEISEGGVLIGGREVNLHVLPWISRTPAKSAPTRRRREVRTVLPVRPQRIVLGTFLRIFENFVGLVDLTITLVRSRLLIHIGMPFLGKPTEGFPDVRLRRLSVHTQNGIVVLVGDRHGSSLPFQSLRSAQP